MKLLASLVLSGALLAPFTACGGDDGGSDSDDSTIGTGPAANLRCASSDKNAFDTYGAAAFVAVNQKLFSLVDAEITANDEANLGGSFKHVPDLAKFKGRLAAFLVYVYGGPGSITYTDGVVYHGDDQDMLAAHTGLAITPEQYDYFVGMIIVPALTQSGVSMDDVASCFAPPITAESFKSAIVNK